MKALIVDDDVDLLDLMAYALGREGYSVLTAMDGLQALERYDEESPEIILLDGNLPKLDGFEVCRRIRHEDPHTPIIMLTARDEEADVLQGLKGGADDYVTKPFSTSQLTARMRAVLRRSQSDPYEEPTRRVHVGELEIDLQSHEVKKAGVEAQLTRLEFRILHMLAMNEGRVVPYSRLIEYAWGYSEGGNSNLLKTHICHVRRKLGFGQKGSGAIKAVLGVGYSLSKP